VTHSSNSVFYVTGFSHRTPLLLFLLLVLLASGIYLSSCSSNNSKTISGFVLSGDQPIESSRVTLIRTGTSSILKVLGSDVSDSTGFFSISYNKPSDPRTVLYLTAVSDVITTAQQTRTSGNNLVRLATVFGTPLGESPTSTVSTTLLVDTYVTVTLYETAFVT
jgi:hypothetical protein